MKEKQSITVTFIFNSEHSPGSTSHLHQVLQSTLKAKGLELINGVVEI
jgi:hypothetical protein